MGIEQIIEQYKVWIDARDIEQLLEARSALAVHLFHLSREIGQLSKDYPKAYSERKIIQAVEYRKASGTSKEREMLSIEKSENALMNEAQKEGELKALKIRFEAIKEINNSIASWLNQLTRL